MNPRYDLVRHFAAHSQVDIRIACDRLIQRYGDRFGLSLLDLDGEIKGESSWSWGDSRCDMFFISFLLIHSRGDIKAKDWEWILPDANYQINFHWSSALDWRTEREIQSALAEILECKLIPLPAKYFA